MNAHREPSAELRAAIRGLRELWNALAAEGFTVTERVEIIAAMMRNVRGEGQQ